MFSEQSNGWRFRVGAFAILCASAVWLMQHWLPASQTTRAAEPEPARWEQVGQIKFVAINPIIKTNGWLITWTGESVWSSGDNGDSWEETNEGLPEPRGVSGVLAHGGRLFAFVNRKLYISDSAGQYWDVVPDAPFALVAPVLDSFVSRGNVIMLGAQRGVIYRSQDGGQTWQTTRRLPDVAVNDLTFVGDRLLAATARGIFVSTDEGETWHEPDEQVNYWLPGKITIQASKEVRTLATVNSQLYAATWGGGVFRSGDNGETWQQNNEGLEMEETADSLYVTSFIPSGRQFLAGTKMGIFTTSNNGGRWRETNNGFTRRSVDRMFALNGQIYATNIGAGAFASKDNGFSWNAAPFPEEVARTIVGRVAGFNESNGRLWAFSGGPDRANGVGYAYSLNDGESWTPMPEANSNIRAQVGASGYIFRATPTGITRSWDDGATFEPFIQGLSITGRPPLGVNTLATDPAQLYAGTEDQGVYATQPTGSRWIRRANRGLAQPNVRALAVKDSMLVAGTKDGSIFVSENKGDDWHGASEGLGAQPITNLLIGQYDIWAATRGNGVFCSSDNGQSWKAMNNGLTSLEVNHLALQGSKIVAATDGGVFVSPDSGLSWAAINNGLPAQPITSVFALGNKLFAGTEDGRILWYNPNPEPLPTPTPTPDPNATLTPTPLPRITPTPTPTPAPTPTPDLSPRTIFYIIGRLTDYRGQGLAGVNVNATEVDGEFTTNVLTDRSGYYRFLLPMGKSYRVTPPATGPRSNFTLYYPDPGFSLVPNLQEDQTVNFAYTLTAPWMPPQ